MIDLHKLLQELESQVNTHQGGHIRPVENYQQWVQSASDTLFTKYIKQWQKTQFVTEALRPFVKSVTIGVSQPQGMTYGQFLLPDDYEYLSALRIRTTDRFDICYPGGSGYVNGQNGKKCDELSDCGSYQDPDEIALLKRDVDNATCEVNLYVVDSNKWGSVCQHPIRKPSIKKPYATQFDGGFKVVPKTIGLVVMDYIRRPVAVKYAYTVGVNDEIVYDQGNSIQLEWSENLKEEFLDLLIGYYAEFTHNDRLLAIRKNV